MPCATVSAPNGWLAPYFGVAVEQYERAVHTLRGTNADWQALSDEVWFKEAQAAAREKRFFNWELEFPEDKRSTFGNRGSFYTTRRNV